MSLKDDIVDLERMLDNAEDEVAINDKAIEIFNQLARIRIFRRYFGYPMGEIVRDVADFKRVLDGIERRRRSGVLDRYHAHVSNTGIAL